MTCRCVADIIHLRVGSSQQAGQFLTVGCRLIEHQQKLAVGKHHARRIGQKALFHILRDAGQCGPVFSKSLPALIQELAAVTADITAASHAVVGKEQVNLINVDMSELSLSPVSDNAVKNRVQHNEQTDGLQVLAQVLNVKAENAVVGVDTGLMGKDIQTAGGEQLQSQSNIVGRRLLLHHQVFVQVLQRGRIALVVLDVLPVDVGGTAVNDRLLLCTDFAAAHQLLTKGHDELTFQHQRIFAVAVFRGQVQSIDIAVLRAGCRNGDYFTAHGPDKGAIFTLRVHHNQVMVG